MKDEFVEEQPKDVEELMDVILNFRIKQDEEHQKLMDDLRKINRKSLKVTIFAWVIIIAGTIITAINLW